MKHYTEILKTANTEQNENVIHQCLVETNFLLMYYNTFLILFQFSGQKL